MLFQIRPDSQSASLLYSGVKPSRRSHSVITLHRPQISKPGAIEGLNSADTSRSLINRGYFLCSVDQERKSIELLSDTLLTIMHDGEIFWSSPALFKSTCRLKVHDYPFDLQVTCERARASDSACRCLSQTKFCPAQRYHLELIFYCLLINLLLLL